MKMVGFIMQAMKRIYAAGTWLIAMETLWVSDLMGVSLWCKYYQMTSASRGWMIDVIEYNGNILVAGNVLYPSGEAYIFLSELDLSGNVLRTRAFRFPTDRTWVYRLTKDSSDNLYMLGTTLNLSSPLYAFVMKLSPTFTPIWDHTDRKAGTWWCLDPSYFASVFKDALIVGNRLWAVGNDEHCTANAGDGKLNIYDLSTGTLVRRYILTMPGGAYPNSDLNLVERVGPNLIFAIGGADWPSNSRIKIFAFDTLGNLLWGKALYTSFNVRPFEGVILPDGNLLIVVATGPNVYTWDVGVVVIDTNLNVLKAWYVRAPGLETIKGATLTPDGHVLITGYTDSWGSNDGFLMKVSPTGDFLWFKTYGGAGDDGLAASVPLSDGTYALVGWSEGYMWLIKTDTAGNTCSMCAPVERSLPLVTFGMSVVSGYSTRSFTFSGVGSPTPLANDLVEASGCTPVGSDHDLSTEERYTGSCPAVRAVYSADGRRVSVVGGRGVRFVVREDGSVRKEIRR